MITILNTSILTAFGLYEYKPLSIENGDRHGMHAHPEKAARGEKCGASKLTESDVRKIRELVAAGVYVKEVANRFHTDVSNVHFIVKRKTWRHVE